MTTHLVTGATGFVGGAIVLELLRQTDDAIVALTRPGKSAPDERLHASLRAAAQTYGLDAAALPLHRVTALAGDLTLPRCGVVGSAGRADVLWHSAASLRFEDRFLEEIRQTNVQGSAAVLELALSMGVSEVNQISTAYVAGHRTGALHEEPVPADAAQNHYERSKIDAEAMFRALDGVRVRILRPSVVVGHSRTLGATTFSGLYGFTRQMFQFRGVLERLQAGMYRSRPLRLRAERDARINLIPIDAVAEQAVRLGLDPQTEGVYHLTQPDPPTVGSAITDIADLLGFATPELIEDDAVELEWLDAQLDQRMGFYRSYVRGSKRFDRSRADAALSDPGVHRALPTVTTMADWYVRHLEAGRRAMPASR